MGGHGALISYFKCPAQYKSVSALAPIYNPMEDQSMKDIFRKYLEEGTRRNFLRSEKNFICIDEQLCKKYDLLELVQVYEGPISYAPILIDDNSSSQSHEKFLQACSRASFPIQVRAHHDFDNSHYFLSTFLEDHLRYHQTEFQQMN